MKKVILASAAIFLLAAGCNKTANVSQSPAQIMQPAGTTISQAPKNVATPPPVPTPTPSAASVIVPTATPTPVPTQKVIDYVKYYGVDGKTALDLLKVLYPGQVQTKVYSGVGEFVESISGVTPDSKHFWEFFVNGKSSNVGASSYVTKTGDVLEWKLSEIH